MPLLELWKQHLTRDEFCSSVKPLDVTPASCVTNNNMADELANYDVEATTTLHGLRPAQLRMERGLPKIWNGC